MADNILKNEFMWEKKQEKKKLYKNWKLYAIALGITVIGASTGLGIYYGITNHSEITKIDLNTLNTSAITGIENMTEETAFQAFLANNTNITNLKENVEISSFTVPNYTTPGSITITAKTNSKKYNGTITVTINAIGQTNLNNLTDIVKEVANTTTKDNALQTFLNANKNKYPDLENNVTLDENSFVAPSYTKTGSYTIIANKTGKYTGSITVTIPIQLPLEEDQIYKLVKKELTNQVIKSNSADSAIELIKGKIATILENNHFKFIENDWKIERMLSAKIIVINYLEYPSFSVRYSSL